MQATELQPRSGTLSLGVQTGDKVDGCSGTWWTHCPALEVFVKEDSRAVAEGVDHVAAT